MPVHASFRVTEDQHKWLLEASGAHGFVNLGEWLRQLAIAAGQSKLGKPFPSRKPVAPEPRKKSRS